MLHLWNRQPQVYCGIRHSLIFCLSFFIVLIPYINIHTHRPVGEGIEVVSAMSGTVVLPPHPCSVGIHPWQIGTPLADFSESHSEIVIFRSVSLPPLNGGDSGEAIPADVMTLEEALRGVETGAVDAIGEIGLDYARPVPHSWQAHVFEAQLDIARERKLPVIIHCVRAFEPTLDLLKKHGMSFLAVFHGFTGSREQAMRATAAGCHISFGARSFASPKTVDAMLSIPLSRFFLETDDDDISIRQVYGEAARLMHETDVEALKRITYNNYKELFGE